MRRLRPITRLKLQPIFWNPNPETSEHKEEEKKQSYLEKPKKKQQVDNKIIFYK
jgi:hypothetical protein